MQLSEGGGPGQSVPKEQQQAELQRTLNNSTKYIDLPAIKLEVD